MSMDDNWRYVNKVNELVDTVNAQNEHLKYLDRLAFELDQRGTWSIVFAIFFTDFFKRWPRWKGKLVERMDVPPATRERLVAEIPGERHLHTVSELPHVEVKSWHE